MNIRYMSNSKPLQVWKHRARICYVTYCVMCTFLSKFGVGPQIMHSNRFKMHLERETMLFEGLIQSTDTSNSSRIHLRSHICNQCKVEKLYWFRLYGITTGAQHGHEKIRNNPSKYTIWTCDIASQSLCLHLVKIQPETRSRSTGLGLPLLDTYDQGVLEWCLSGAIHIRGPPTRNQCHVIAIYIIRRRTLNLYPEVFYRKLWSMIYSYPIEHEMWPKYGILSELWLHAKLEKTSKSVFAVLSSSCRYLLSDFGG